VLFGEFPDTVDEQTNNAILVTVGGGAAIEWGFQADDPGEGVIG